MKEKMKEILKDAGLTQRDVAKILCINQSAVARLVNTCSFGKRTAKQWEQAFGFCQNWLMNGEGDIFTSDHPKIYEYKNGVNYGNVSQSVKKNTGCIGEVELQNSAQSWEIEKSILQQRISDLENMVNMKDEIIFTLKESISLLKKLTQST